MNYSKIPDNTLILSRQLVLAWQFSFISHFGEVVKYSERNAEEWGGGGGGEGEFEQEPVHNVWRQIAHLQSGRKWNFLNAGLCLNETSFIEDDYLGLV